MHYLLLWGLIAAFWSIPCSAKLDAPDSFYDDRVDYGKFIGRVTDRGKDGSILRVHSKNRNIRFFRVGDNVSFRMVARDEGEFCRAHVRGVEDNYFVLYVRNISDCLRKDEFFRRGAMILIKSRYLAKRVFDAGSYRNILIRRKKDLLKQLRDINNFIWSYDKKRIKVVAEYDKKIMRLKQAKQRALEKLLNKKYESIVLQRKIPSYLDSLERDMKFYRIDKGGELLDRWSMDHNLELPVSKGMPVIKSVDSKYLQEMKDNF